MAERKPRRTSGGPWLTIACLCERATLDESDNTISINKVVNQIAIELVRTGPDGSRIVPDEHQLPEAVPPSNQTLTLVLAFRSGDFVGEYPVSIEMETPEGRRTQLPEQTLALQGGTQGVNLVLAVTIAIGRRGQLWFNVRGGPRKRLLTRVPLNVVFRPGHV